jgi:hypothetical protein
VVIQNLLPPSRYYSFNPDKEKAMKNLSEDLSTLAPEDAYPYVYIKRNVRQLYETAD